MPSRARRLLPLVFATTATQASIVVLAPLIVEIGDGLDASVSAVGLARSVLAATAVAGSLAIGPMIDRIGVRPLIVRGAALGLLGAGRVGRRAVAAVLLCGERDHRARRGLPALGRLRRRRGALRRPRRAVGDGLRGRRAVARLDRRQPDHRRARRRPAAGGSPTWCPATICLAALVAGLRAPPESTPVAEAGERDTIRSGLEAVFRDPPRAAGRSPSWSPTRPGPRS